MQKQITMRLLFILFLFAPLSLWAQVKQYDKLEMLYDQGHYKKVLRNANKLLKKPEHQNAILPVYYKSLAELQLFRVEKWRKRNPSAFSEASKQLVELRSKDKDGKVLKIHAFEIQSLKRDYDYFLEELQQNKKANSKIIAELNKGYAEVFQNIDDIQDSKDKNTAPPLTADISDLRKKIVSFAYKFQGTKYRSGGEDPNGFDCSGFVSYVFSEFKISLPRISRDMQKSSTPLKIIDVQPGDLVFFDSGAGGNHVGLVAENKNGFVTMIHSSTSQGIVLTDIETSNYWKTRLHSFGTFLKD